MHRRDVSVAKCDIIHGSASVLDSDAIITGLDEPPSHISPACFVETHCHGFGVFTPLSDTKEISEGQAIPFWRAVSFGIFSRLCEKNAEVVTKSGEVELLKLVRRAVPSDKFLLVFRFHSDSTLFVAIARQGWKDMRPLSTLADGTYEYHSQPLFYLVSHFQCHGQIQSLHLPLESLGRNLVHRSC